MRATLIVLLVTMSMLPLGYMVYPPATAGNITVQVTRFGNDQEEVIVDFPSAGIDDSNSLSLQTGLYIDQVKMKVSTVDQGPGMKNYPSNVTIDFGGDNMLEYQWRGPGYGALGHQTTFTNGRPYMNATLGTYGPYNDTVAFRLPKTAHVRSATMNLSTGERVGTPGKVLVLNGASNYYGWDTDPVNKLAAFTSDFSVVDRFDAYSSTPVWDEISDYYAILTYTDLIYGYGYQDGGAVGDLLADYVDAGGCVVATIGALYGYSPYMLSGRWTSGGYNVFSSGSSLTTSSSGVGKTAIAGHPVMNNVTSMSFPYYGYTYRIYSNSLTAGSQIISYWSDNYIMAAQKNIGGVDRVDLNMWPVSMDASGMYGSWPYMAYSGDGDDLMKNALLFGGRKPISFTLDMLNDSTIEVNETDYLGNKTIPDFSGMLNDYLEDAPVSFTDQFGNAFVDIPMNVTAAKSGYVGFNKLDVYYDYNIWVDANPANGNLTLAISDLQSTVQGQDNFTIPIYVTSASAGQVKLSDLYIKMTPPIHSPRVGSFFPALNTVVREDSSVDLGVNATDIYRNPMTYEWSHNGMVVEGAATDRLSLDFGFENAGNHTVTVKIMNGIKETTFTILTWNLVVLNVNRPPSIDEFVPQTDPRIDENASQTFRVSASDPDKDPLVYAWSLDGKIVPNAAGDNYTYTSDFFSSGEHNVKVVVTDPSSASVSKTWQARVANVNVPPLISDWSPRTDPRIRETESWTFSVTPFDQDKNQTLTTSWFLDDQPAFIGNPYTYTSDYRSSGIHKVKASVSDGDSTVSREWKLTVDNLNRLPSPAIDAPADMSEYMEGDAIHFSAKSSSDPDGELLSFTWKEGGVNVSDQMEFDRSFTPGLHTLVLEVRDPSNGVATSSVRFRVRYVEISVVVGLDRFEIQAGNKVDVIVTMSNIGDANATNVPVEVQVDGTALGSKTMPGIKAGGAEKEIFQWKAVKGTHTITAKVGDKTWTKQVTVAAAPAPPPSAGINDYIWPMVIVVVAVGLMGFGAMVLRKK